MRLVPCIFKDLPEGRLFVSDGTVYRKEEMIRSSNAWDIERQEKANFPSFWTVYVAPNKSMK